MSIKTEWRLILTTSIYEDSQKTKKGDTFYFLFIQDKPAA